MSVPQGIHLRAFINEFKCILFKANKTDSSLATLATSSPADINNNNVNNFKDNSSPANCNKANQTTSSVCHILQDNKQAFLARRLLMFYFKNNFNDIQIYFKRGWESDSSRTDTMTTTPMTTTVTMTTTPRTTTSYFPSSSSDESNEIQYRQKTTNHPTRPTRPPKIPTVETINYFPQASDLQSGNEGVQEVNVNKIVSWKPTPFTTTSTTTTTQSTTTTTSYAPVVFQETPLTQQPTVQFQPPPRSSTHILATPNPHVPIVENNQPTGGCGVPVLNHQCPKGRIVNGTQSCYGQFPWQASFTKNTTSLHYYALLIPTPFCLLTAPGTPRPI